MNTIERTQIEIFKNADHSQAARTDARDLTDSVAANVLPLADWELLYACGGENTGAW